MNASDSGAFKLDHQRGVSQMYGADIQATASPSTDEDESHEDVEDEPNSGTFATKSFELIRKLAANQLPILEEECKQHGSESNNHKDQRKHTHRGESRRKTRSNNKFLTFFQENKFFHITYNSFK